VIKFYKTFFFILVANQMNQSVGTLSSRPPSRPRKPPRLLISPSYNNHINEQERRPIIGRKKAFVFLTNFFDICIQYQDTVDNTEYFNLPDRTPQVWPECLSDFSTDQTVSGNSSIHSTTPPKGKFEN